MLRRMGAYSPRRGCRDDKTPNDKPAVALLSEADEAGAMQPNDDPGNRDYKQCAECERSHTLVRRDGG